MPTRTRDYAPANLLLLPTELNKRAFGLDRRRALHAHATSPEYEANCTTLFTYRAAPAPEPLYARTAFQTSF